MADEKKRYSDEELEEFRGIINEMLAKAKAEYRQLRNIVMHNGSNDIEDTTPSFKTIEDGGSVQLTREEAGQKAERERTKDHGTLSGLIWALALNPAKAVPLSLHHRRCAAAVACPAATTVLEGKITA